MEVITLSLTFDHRVVNGAGAANFVHEIKELIEGFAIPVGGCGFLNLSARSIYFSNSSRAAGKISSSQRA